MTNEQSEQIAKCARAVADALDEVAQAIIQVIEQFMEKAWEAIDRFYQAIHNAYREAGYPHGDTPEGLMRWLDQPAEERGLP
jgi:uncharacterized protein YijF (DUF1287 family)